MDRYVALSGSAGYYDLGFELVCQRCGQGYRGKDFVGVANCFGFWNGEYDAGRHLVYM